MNDKNKRVSKYSGSPGVWIEFLSKWGGLSRDVPVWKKSKDFFSIESRGLLPKSFCDFYVAMESLGWPKLIGLFGEARDTFLDFNKLERIEPLAFSDAHYHEVAKEESDKVLSIFSKDDYFDYSRDQYPAFYFKAFFASFVVASKSDSDSVFGSYLVLNPLVRSGDGEWEATYYDIYGHFSVNFISFADAISWLYQSNMRLHQDEGEKPWFDHTFDTTGLSKILFKD